jgi:6,7-dimethyl-8-ribityllumazine synthase
VSEGWPGEVNEAEEQVEAQNGAEPDERSEEEPLEIEDERLEVEENVHELPLEEEPILEEEDEGPSVAEHAGGELDIPDDVDVLEGEPDGTRRGVAIVAARFNGEITNQLLSSAMDELDRIGVRREAITVMPVPGAFELPLAAMALAKTRRYACVVALGCVIRGETPHFEYVASEAASGLQLAALETGVPVAFGVLTVENVEQAEARIEKGAEAVRTALEMADAFSQLRATAVKAAG